LASSKPKAMDKFVGKVFLDADGDKTYVVRGVQYAERGKGAGSTMRRRAFELSRERVNRGRFRLHRLRRVAR
jgi:hypothetical protein